MHQRLVHLFEVHGYRRITFILGTPNDPIYQARYRAYSDILTEYELPFEENILPALTETTIKLKNDGLRFESLHHLCTGLRTLLIYEAQLVLFQA